LAITARQEHTLQLLECMTLEGWLESSLLLLLAVAFPAMSVP